VRLNRRQFCATTGGGSVGDRRRFGSGAIARLVPGRTVRHVHPLRFVRDARAGEWVMHNERIPAADYQKRISLFNPSEFDARAWVGLAKAAGQRYMTVTSKHHEGFCMFGRPAATSALCTRRSGAT